MPSHVNEGGSNCAPGAPVIGPSAASRARSADHRAVARRRRSGNSSAARKLPAPSMFCAITFGLPGRWRPIWRARMRAPQVVAAADAETDDHLHGLAGVITRRRLGAGAWSAHRLRCKGAHDQREHTPQLLPVAHLRSSQRAGRMTPPRLLLHEPLQLHLVGEAGVDDALRRPPRSTPARRARGFPE